MYSGVFNVCQNQSSIKKHFSFLFSLSSFLLNDDSSYLGLVFIQQLYNQLQPFSYSSCISILHFLQPL